MTPQDTRLTTAPNFFAESGGRVGLRAAGGQDKAKDQGGANADQGHREDPGDPRPGEELSSQ